MSGKIPRRTVRLAAAMIAAAAVSVAMASAASASEVVYNNLPSPTPANVPSVGFEATSASEFGGAVKFANTARTNPSVTVLMSSWGCQTGHWNEYTCKTEAGAKFEEPITVSIYALGAGNTVGTKLAAASKTFKIAYRPSANLTKCTGAEVGKWYSKGVCYNGKAVKVTVPLKVAKLPEEAIVSVSYNTSDHGYAPYGDATACHATSAGCGYDSLNVGLTELSEGAPTTGENPLDESVFWNTSFGPFYCDGGAGGTGTFRFDEGCWKGEQPMFTVKAS